MPYQPEPSPARAAPSGGTGSEWRSQPPTLAGRSLLLREPREEDGPQLLLLLNQQEVLRFISPSPASVDGFVRFIRWTQAEREAGRQLCFGLVPEGHDFPVGLFQVRQTEPGFYTAEWGFALGAPYWGRGLFEQGARLVMDFVFGTVGVRRLEARSCVGNARGNAALRKIGAGQEAILRGAFLRDGVYHDQILWTVVDDDWRQVKACRGN